MTSRVLTSSQPTLDLLLGEPLGFRYRTSSIDVIVAGASVIVTPKTGADDSFEEVERVALSLLEKLPETPIRAFGLNFGYDVSGDGYGRVDLDDLAARAGVVTMGKMTAQRIQESYAIDDYVINMTTIRDATGRVVIELNHHAELPSPHLGTAHIAARQIRGRFLAARTLSERLIHERHDSKKGMS